MALPSSASLPNYPAFANARTYDAEFDRMVAQCMAFGEGIAPFDQTKDCTITSMGANKATDLEVTTNSSGLQLSVALGNAWVQGDTRSTQGLYFCHVPTANVVTLEAAHGTHPRIDAVILQVADADASGGSTNWSVTYTKGTATSGATLTNLTGAPTIPDSALLLAYVLVPATFAGPFVNATHVLDSRFFAYRPGRLVGRVTTTSDSVGAGDKLGPLTVCGNNIHPIKVKARANIASSGGAGSAIRVEIRDGAAGAGTMYDKSEHSQAAANYICPHNPETQVTFNGQKSFYLNMQNSSGTPTLYAASYGTTFMEARYA